MESSEQKTTKSQVRAAMWIGIGAVLGLSYGVLFGDLAYSLAIGVALGAALGERYYRSKDN